MEILTGSRKYEMAFSRAYYRGTRVAVMAHVSTIGMSREVKHPRRERYVDHGNKMEVQGGYLKA